MYYVFIHSDGSQYIARSLNQLAKKAQLTANYMAKLLKTSKRHGNQRFMLLKFEDSELIKQIPRNPAGNREALLKGAVKQAKKAQIPTQDQFCDTD